MLDPNDEPAIRERAKQWATDALGFDEPMATMIHAYVDDMPVTLVGMPYCKACESVLCGVCGSHVLHLIGPLVTSAAPPRRL